MTMTQKSRFVYYFLSLGIILFALSLVISLCSLGKNISDLTGHFRKLHNGTLSKRSILKTLIRVVRNTDESSEEDLLTDDIFIGEFFEAANRYRAIHGVPKLKRNETLAKECEQWAKVLAQRSDQAGQPIFNYSHVYLTGESIWGGRDFTSVSGTTVVTKFYSECSKHSWVDNFFMPESSHFTQLVWKDTESAGVAKVTSPKEGITIIVARYWPAGNWAYKSSFKNNVFPATVRQNDRQDSVDRCFSGTDILKFKTPRNPRRHIKHNITGRVFRRRKFDKTTQPSVIPNVDLHFIDSTKTPSSTNTSTATPVTVPINSTTTATTEATTQIPTTSTTGITVSTTISPTTSTTVSSTVPTAPSTTPTTTPTTIPTTIPTTPSTTTPTTVPTAVPTAPSTTTIPTTPSTTTPTTAPTTIPTTPSTTTATVPTTIPATSSATTTNSTTSVETTLPTTSPSTTESASTTTIPNTTPSVTVSTILPSVSTSAVTSSTDDESHARSIFMLKKLKHVGTSGITATTTTRPKHVIMVVTNRAEPSSSNMTEAPVPAAFSFDEYDDPFEDIIRPQTFDEYDYDERKENESSIHNATQKGRVLIMNVLGNSSKLSEKDARNSSWNSAIESIENNPNATGRNMKVLNPINTNHGNTSLILVDEGLKLGASLDRHEHILKQIGHHIKSAELQNRMLLEKIVSLEKVILDLTLSKSGKLSTTTIASTEKPVSSTTPKKKTESNSQNNLKENEDNKSSLPNTNSVRSPSPEVPKEVLLNQSTHDALLTRKEGTLNSKDKGNQNNSRENYPPIEDSTPVQETSQYSLEGILQKIPWTTTEPPKLGKSLTRHYVKKQRKPIRVPTTKRTKHAPVNNWKDSSEEEIVLNQRRKANRNKTLRKTIPQNQDIKTSEEGTIPENLGRSAAKKNYVAPVQKPEESTTKRMKHVINWKDSSEELLTSKQGKANRNKTRRKMISHNQDAKTSAEENYPPDNFGRSLTKKNVTLEKTEKIDKENATEGSGTNSPQINPKQSTTPQNSISAGEGATTTQDSLQKSETTEQPLSRRRSLIFFP